MSVPPIPPSPEKFRVDMPRSMRLDPDSLLPVEIPNTPQHHKASEIVRDFAAAANTALPKALSLVACGGHNGVEPILQRYEAEAGALQDPSGWDTAAAAGLKVGGKATAPVELMRQVATVMLNGTQAMEQDYWRLHFIVRHPAAFAAIIDGVIDLQMAALLEKLQPDLRLPDMSLTMLDPKKALAMMDTANKTADALRDRATYERMKAVGERDLKHFKAQIEHTVTAGVLASIGFSALIWGVRHLATKKAQQQGVSEEALNAWRQGRGQLPPNIGLGVRVGMRARALPFALAAAALAVSEVFSQTSKFFKENSTGRLIAAQMDAQIPAYRRQAAQEHGATQIAPALTLPPPHLSHAAPGRGVEPPALRPPSQMPAGARRFVAPPAVSLRQVVQESGVMKPLPPMKPIFGNR